MNKTNGIIIGFISTLLVTMVASAQSPEQDRLHALATMRAADATIAARSVVATRQAHDVLETAIAIRATAQAEIEATNAQATRSIQATREAVLMQETVQSASATRQAQATTGAIAIQATTQAMSIMATDIAIEQTERQAQAMQSITIRAIAIIVMIGTFLVLGVSLVIISNSVIRLLEKKETTEPQLLLDVEMEESTSFAPVIMDTSGILDANIERLIHEQHNY